MCVQVWRSKTTLQISPSTLMWILRLNSGHQACTASTLPQSSSPYIWYLKAFIWHVCVCAHACMLTHIASVHGWQGAHVEVGWQLLRVLLLLPCGFWGLSLVSLRGPSLAASPLYQLSLLASPCVDQSGLKFMAILWSPKFRNYKYPPHLLV